jgi:hypothetical protein
MPNVSLNSHESRLVALTVMLEQLYVERFRDAPVEALDAVEQTTLARLRPFNDDVQNYAKTFHRRLRAELR